MGVGGGWKCIQTPTLKGTSARSHDVSEKKDLGDTTGDGCADGIHSEVLRQEGP